MGRREDIEARLRQLEAEYVQLSRFPATDVFAENTIITWSKTFTASDTARSTNYSYAVIRANDRWWTTGATSMGSNGTRGRTYDELLDLIGDGTNVRIIDPDVGVELDDMVIEMGDDGLPWRNRIKEARNAAEKDVIIGDVSNWVEPSSDVITASDWAGPADVVERQFDFTVRPGETAQSALTNMTLEFALTKPSNRSDILVKFVDDGKTVGGGGNRTAWVSGPRAQVEAFMKMHGYEVAVEVPSTPSPESER